MKRHFYILEWRPNPTWRTDRRTVKFTMYIPTLAIVMQEVKHLKKRRALHIRWSKYIKVSTNDG